MLAFPCSAPEAGELRWADAEIRLPPDIRRFIAEECRAAQPNPFETWSECVRGESFGYRAVVTMLLDEGDGERAASRYRACQGGLGSLGGRFHRRRADCIGMPLGYLWRFEHSEQT